MARAAVVADRELLVDDGLVPAPLERPAGGETHHAGADDRDPHRRSPDTMFGSSTPMPPRISELPIHSELDLRRRGCSQRSSPCSRMQPVPTVPEPSTSPGPQLGVARRLREDRTPTSGSMSPRFPRERSSPFTRATISRRRSPSSSGVTSDRPERGGEVLALRRAEADLHLLPLEVARRPVVHDREAADLRRRRRSPPRPRARSRAPRVPSGYGISSSGP